MHLLAFNDGRCIFDVIEHLIITMNVQYDTWNAKLYIVIIKFDNLENHLNVKFNNLKNCLNTRFDNFEICIMAELVYFISFLILIMIIFTVL